MAGFAFFGELFLIILLINAAWTERKLLSVHRPFRIQIESSGNESDTPIASPMIWAIAEVFVASAAAYSAPGVVPAPVSGRLGAPTAVFTPPAAGFALNPFQPQPERLVVDGARIDYSMEMVHLTKRRVSGGVAIDAPAESIWACLTDYAAWPDFIPNILSNDVETRADGSAEIRQVALLSRRLGLEAEMTLEAQPVDGNCLRLRRTGGHGFLEFDATYTLSGSGADRYLSYQVELVPCPIFPLPLVEQKIRKTVPSMLAAVQQRARQNARLGSSSS